MCKIIMHHAYAIQLGDPVPCMLQHNFNIAAVLYRIQHHIFAKELRVVWGVGVMRALKESKAHDPIVFFGSPPPNHLLSQLEWRFSPKNISIRVWRPNGRML
jgi:hypothetical protein